METAVSTASILEQGSRRLREDVVANCEAFLERHILAAQSFRETEGEPVRSVRMARATEHIFAQMPIKIRPGERLAGWHPNTHPDEKMQKEIQEAEQYLAAQNYTVPASEGHMAPDYPTVLCRGLQAIYGEVVEREQQCDPADPHTPSSKILYQTAAISLRALQNFIRRYAQLSAAMVQETEDPEWATDLTEIAAICEHIATGPARNFREAIQLTWFIFLAVAIEHGTAHQCFGTGRLDQYLHPYYRQDCEAGIADEKLVDTLIEQLFIKHNEFLYLLESAVIVVVGGRKPDGTDATNELSFKCLEASDRVGLYFPGIDVSWHADMDEEFVRAACRLLRNMKGQPAFFNSDLIIEGLGRYGVPYEHAVDHLPSTCTETSIMGRSNPWVAWPYCNLPLCLLYALYDGKPPFEDIPERPGSGLPQTYQELREALAYQIEYEAHKAIEFGNRCQTLASWYRPFPLLSCFIQGCLETGRNICEGGALYNFLQPEAVGTPNVVDGLAAVKTLVEEQKRFTLDDFRGALSDNFEGHEELRRAVLYDCPKYGNDDEEINALFGEVAGGWCSAIEGHQNYLGGPVLPGFLAWMVWIKFGKNTPATPDGRKAGEPMANSFAPSPGVAAKGAPAVILSAREFDQARGLGGTTFNLRFSSKMLDTKAGVERLKGFIETSFDLGTYMLYIDLVSSELLRAAQQHPKEHEDVFIRIGGYLVPFVLLDEYAQEEVIARTELGL